MTTTGELRAIIEELQLIDGGDAASYFSEKALVADESLVSNLQEGLSGSSVGFNDYYCATSYEDSSFR